MWLMKAILNANKVHSCKSIKKMDKYNKSSKQRFVAKKHIFRRLGGKSARRLTTAWDSMCVSISICLWKKTKSALHQWQQESLLFDSSPSRYWFSDGSERIRAKHPDGSDRHTRHMYTLTLRSCIYIIIFSSVLCLRTCNLGERTQDGPNPCQEFGPGTFPAGCFEKPGLLS